jgi:hypothetical protein
VILIALVELKPSASGKCAPSKAVKAVSIPIEGKSAGERAGTRKRGKSFDVGCVSMP